VEVRLRKTVGFAENAALAWAPTPLEAQLQRRMPQKLQQ